MSMQERGASRLARGAHAATRARTASGRRSEPEAGAPQILVHSVADGDVGPVTVSQTFAHALQQAPGGSIARAILTHPDADAIAEIASLWQLHPVLVEDLLHAGQRPKVERYGDVLFIVLRAAHYIDEREDVEFSEFHLLVRHDALVIICQDGRSIDGSPIPNPLDISAGSPLLSREYLDVDRQLLRLGAEAMAYRLLDEVVDQYFPVLDGLQIDQEQIERQVFSGDAAAAERIYHLSQEVIDVLHASAALTRLTQRLRRGADQYAIPEELQSYLQDVSDHLTRVSSEATELRDALSQILTVNSTLVAQRQNDDMKKISGWAAILFAPTLIAAVYGMNFDQMPELHWAFGYPLAVGGMVGFAALLYGVFRWKKWM